MLAKKLVVPVILCATSAVFADAWQEAGPYVIQNGQVEGMAGQKNPVIGAVKSVLTLSPDVAILGSINGGIWRTSNFSAASPNWTNVTPAAPSLSLGSIESSLNDQSFIVAGLGNHSSYGGEGGPLNGLMKSTDLGLTWSPINNATLNGVNVTAVLPRATNVILVSGRNDTFSTPVSTKQGLYRTQDGGINFTNLAGDPDTKLPVGEYTDLAFAPGNLSAMYVAVVGTADPADAGIWRTESSGIGEWTHVYDAPAGTVNIRLAGRTNTFTGANSVYAAIVTGTNGDAKLSEVVRTKNDGGTWADLGIPDSDGFGIHNGPNAQGQVHLSITADPTNDNVVYIGGQSQDGAFPNQLGANDYSGRLFRGTFDTVNGGATWDSLTHTGNIGAGQTIDGGTASNSAPHADSRDFSFVGTNLAEGDDGGIYLRTSPKDNTGDWVSKIGTGLQITECYTVAIDPVSGIIMAANQDTGTMQQTEKGSKTYTEIPRNMAGTSFLTGDGGRAVAAKLDATSSVRYSAFNDMSGLQRAVYGADGKTAISIDTCDNTGPGGKPLNEEAAFNTPLPFDVNSVDNNRLIAGSITDQVDDGAGGKIQRNGAVFVSPNKGKSWNKIDGIAAGESVTSVLYGGNKAGLGETQLVFAATNASSIYRRITIGNDLVPLTGYSGGIPLDMAVDSKSWNNLFSVDNSNVWATINADAATPGDVEFRDITGNLPGGLKPQAILFISEGADSMLIAGGFGGVYDIAGTNLFNFFSTDDISLLNWSLLGTDLPSVQVKDLAYDPATHMVAVATLGRGIFTVAVPEPGAISVLLIGASALLRRARKHA